MEAIIIENPAIVSDPQLVTIRFGENVAVVEEFIGEVGPAETLRAFLTADYTDFTKNFCVHLRYPRLINPVGRNGHPLWKSTDRRCGRFLFNHRLHRLHR